MSKHILFDAVTNILAARYDSEINGDNIPAEAIEVDEVTFFATIDEQDGIWKLTPDGVVKTPFPAPSLSDLKDAKYNEIRDAYNIAADMPVTALSATWNGGFDSAIKLDAAKRLSESAGASGVRFYDIDNVAHDLSFADALTVCIAVAVAYQTALGNKQTKFAAIKAATTKAQVNAITW